MRSMAGSTSTSQPSRTSGSSLTSPPENFPSGPSNSLYGKGTCLTSPFAIREPWSRASGTPLGGWGRLVGISRPSRSRPRSWARNMTCTAVPRADLSTPRSGNRRGGVSNKPQTFRKVLGSHQTCQHQRREDVQVQWKCLHSQGCPAHLLSEPAQDVPLEPPLQNGHGHSGNRLRRENLQPSQGNGGEVQASSRGRIQRIRRGILTAFLRRNE